MTSNGYFGNRNSLTHGHSTEAAGRSPTYRTWEQMKGRCNNQNDDHYPRYGARGIRVCSSWAEFANFLADMGERPAGSTIDRIDNDADYMPGNCRWATPKEQARNRSNSMMVTYRGRTQALTAWCEELGLACPAVRCRLKAGWPVDDAFTKPKHSRISAKAKAA